MLSRYFNKGYALTLTQFYAHPTAREQAALLTGMEYRKEYDEAYIEELTAALHEKGVGTVVLTGVSYEPETTGVAVSGKGFRGYYRHARLARTCHGTGDLFASAFTGLLCRGYEAFPAAEAAAVAMAEAASAAENADNKQTIPRDIVAGYCFAIVRGNATLCKLNNACFAGESACSRPYISFQQSEKSSKIGIYTGVEKVVETVDNSL